MSICERPLFSGAARLAWPLMSLVFTSLVGASSTGCHRSAADEQRALCMSIEDPVIAEQMGCTADAGVGDGGTADACMNPMPPAAAPTLHPGHSPLSITVGGAAGLPGVNLGPPPTVNPAAPRTTFECYGACGPSCNMNGRIPSSGYRYVNRCTEWQNCDGTWQHREDAYRMVSGQSHPFCRWHDACYARCQQTYGDPGSRSPTTDYGRCVLACDAECSPSLTGGICGAGGLVGGMTGAEIIRRYGPVVNPPGGTWPTNPPGLPGFPNPRTWGAYQCTQWPQGNGSTGAPSDGRVTFSSLISSTTGGGRCAPGGPSRIVTTLQRVQAEQTTGETESYAWIDQNELSEDPNDFVIEEEVTEPPTECATLDRSACENAGSCGWFDAARSDSAETGCYDADAIAELLSCDTGTASE